MITVCLACGKVKGRHRWWDVSCEIHSHEFDENACTFNADGRVTAG